MFDIQHDSPVPIHEQIASQIRVHVATGALKAGAILAEYRAFAQELLTNPDRLRSMERAVDGLASADFSWKTSAQKTIEVYEHVVNGSR